MATIPVVRITFAEPVARPLTPVHPSFCPYEHPRLAELRSRWKLLAVAGDGDDFSRACRLRRWVRSRWDHGYDKLPDMTDGVAILEAAAAGHSFFCCTYATLLVQCSLAVGLPARRVDIWRQHWDYPVGLGMRGNHGHSVTEIYCREWRRWIVFDADLNVHYERAGEPLGASDLQAAWLSGDIDGVHQVRDEPGFVQPTCIPGFSARESHQFWVDFDAHQAIDYYSYLQVFEQQGYARDDVLDVPNRLFTYTRLQPPPVAVRCGQPARAFCCVGEEAHFNWPVGRTWLDARLAGSRPSRTIDLAFGHNLHAFHHFELKLNDSPWSRLRGASRQLTLEYGEHQLQGRAVDALGRPAEAAALGLSITRMQKETP